MNHRSLIASLSSEQRSRLTRKSDLRGLIHLALHWGGILALGWLIIERVPFWPLLMPAQGVLIIFLFTLLHETIHLTVFETAWLNRAVARVCGFLMVLPSAWFRYFHFAHHRHTQDPEKDPELAVPKPATWREYLVHISGLPVWYSQIKTVARNALGRCEDTFVPNIRARKGPQRGPDNDHRLCAGDHCIGYQRIGGITLCLGAACRSWGNRSYVSISWPNMGAARKWRTCSKIAGRPSPTG